MLRKMFFRRTITIIVVSGTAITLVVYTLWKMVTMWKKKYKISALQANGWILAEINMRNGLPTCPNTGTSMRATNTRVLK